MQDCDKFAENIPPHQLSLIILLEPSLKLVESSEHWWWRIMSVLLSLFVLHAWPAVLKNLDPLMHTTQWNAVPVFYSKSGMNFI